MALTKTVIKDSIDVFGKHRVVMYDITGDSSYPTGGYSIAAADVGLKEIRGVQFVGGNATAGGVIAHWDNANKKLMLLFPTGGAAIPATLIAPATSVPSGGTAVTSTAAQPNLVETAGIAAEVANATDVSTVKVRALFIGV